MQHLQELWHSYMPCCFPFVSTESSNISLNKVNPSSRSQSWMGGELDLFKFQQNEYMVLGHNTAGEERALNAKENIRNHFSNPEWTCLAFSLWRNVLLFVSMFVYNWTTVRMNIKEQNRHAINQIHEVFPFSRFCMLLTLIGIRTEFKERAK